MRNFLSGLLFLVINISVLSQKLTVQVIRWDKSDLSEWQILDAANEIVFSSINNLFTDTIAFSLEANLRYKLKINFCEVSLPDKALYSLLIEGEPIMLIKSEAEPGEYLFPFFTGIRNRDNKITGGTNALISDFPWQVYFITGNFLCGGSIINENWILTAAHCTKNENGSPIPASSMSVKIGATNPNNSLEGEVYNVSQIIVNENFDSQTLENDIALLKLDRPIDNTNARPIKLITSEDVDYGATVPGVMSWVSGWGLIRVNPDVYATDLQKVQLPIVSNAQAAAVWNTIPSTDIMAGFFNGNKDACNGDSGGPLVVPVFDEYKLAGIVSWGSANCNTYGAYTRVSDFENWIRSKTGIVKEYRPPAPVGDTLICEGLATSQYSVGIIPGATLFEWDLLPAVAGVVSGNSENATISWNAGVIGSVTLIARVTINNVVSEWSRLTMKVIKNTRLLSQSGDTTLCEENGLSLNVGAEGYNLAYTWYKNGVFDQSSSAGQLRILNVIPDNSGDYICEIAGTCGTLFSNSMNLTVLPLTKITNISPDLDLAFGGDGYIDVNAEGHNLDYQWQKDNVTIENSNSSRLLLENLNATNTGLYLTTVKGTCGTQISDNVYIYVKRSDYTVEPEVFLWPSVTSNKFNVALSSDEKYTILLFNSMGNIIREITNCRYQATIDISSSPRGVYLLNVYNNNFRKTLRLIKK